MRCSDTTAKGGGVTATTITSTKGTGAFRLAWAASCTLLALIWAILLTPGTALAKGTYDLKAVDSYDRVPNTEVYIDRINGRKPDTIATSPKVSSVQKAWGDGRAYTQYHINDSGRYSASAPAKISNAIVLTYKDAGHDLAGRPVDLKMSIDMGWYTVGGSTSFVNVMNTPAEGGGAVELNSGTDSASSQVACSYDVHMEVSYKDGTPVTGRTQMYFYDIDQLGAFTEKWYAEAVELVDGFSRDVYVKNGTWLNRSDISSKGYIHNSTNASDWDGSNTDCVVFLEKGRGTFRWQGSSCSTGVMSKYTAAYPPVDEAPTKSVSASEVLPGDTVTFSVTQTLPYTASDNAAKTVTVTDVLDTYLSCNASDLRVMRGTTDVTGQWDCKVSGKTVTFTAKNTTDAWGELTFKIPATVSYGCPERTVTNTATVDVTTKTNTTIKKTSNEASFKVGVSPDAITVTKRVRAEDVDTVHGDPVFPFTVKVEAKGRDPYVIHRMVTLQDAGGSWYTGSFTLSAWDDLGLGRGNEGTVTVSEVPVSRFRLESVTGDTPGAAASGDKVVFTVGRRLDRDLAATFTNKKVTDAYFGHNAAATNVMVLPPQ